MKSVYVCIRMHKSVQMKTLKCTYTSVMHTFNIGSKVTLLSYLGSRMPSPMSVTPICTFLTLFPGTGDAFGSFNSDEHEDAGRQIKSELQDCDYDTGDGEFCLLLFIIIYYILYIIYLLYRLYYSYLFIIYVRNQRSKQTAGRRHVDGNNNITTCVLCGRDHRCCQCALQPPQTTPHVSLRSPAGRFFAVPAGLGGAAVFITVSPRMCEEYLQDPVRGVNCTGEIRARRRRQSRW